MGIFLWKKSNIDPIPVYTVLSCCLSLGPKRSKRICLLLIFLITQMFPSFWRNYWHISASLKKNDQMNTFNKMKSPWWNALSPYFLYLLYTSSSTHFLRNRKNGWKILFLQEHFLTLSYYLFSTWGPYLREKRFWLGDARLCYLSTYQYLNLSLSLWIWLSYFKNPLLSNAFALIYLVTIIHITWLEISTNVDIYTGGRHLNSLRIHWEASSAIPLA